jgi:hypothetical protein
VAVSGDPPQKGESGVGGWWGSRRRFLILGASRPKLAV